MQKLAYYNRSGSHHDFPMQTFRIDSGYGEVHSKFHTRYRKIKICHWINRKFCEQKSVGLKKRCNPEVL